MESTSNVNSFPTIYNEGDFNNGEYMLATELYQFLELHEAHYAKWFKKNITGNDFFESGIDYSLFTLEGELRKRGKQKQEAKLSLEMAKRISMKSGSEKGEQVRSYFLQMEKQAQIKELPASPALVALQSAQALYEQSLRVEKLEQKVLELEAKTELNSGLTGYYTIKGFCVIHGLRIDLIEANKRGRAATKLSKGYQVEVAKQGDQNFGLVNAYREDILEEVFEDLIN